MNNVRSKEINLPVILSGGGIKITRTTNHSDPWSFIHVELPKDRRWLRKRFITEGLYKGARQWDSGHWLFKTLAYHIIVTLNMKYIWIYEQFSIVLFCDFALMYYFYLFEHWNIWWIFFTYFYISNKNDKNEGVT